MTLRRLIPYSSALAVLAVGCNDASSPLGFLQDVASDASSDTASDAGTDSTSLDDVRVMDVVTRPDAVEQDAVEQDAVGSDVGPVDAGAPDVTTRPDAADDASADAGSPSISDETRQALRTLCERFEECGFGPERQCVSDVTEGLLEYAYQYSGDTFEACDAALGRFFTCLDEQLERECTEEATYSCPTEQRDIAYDCGLYDGY